jgi:subtilisin family serine protease
MSDYPISLKHDSGLEMTLESELMVLGLRQPTHRDDLAVHLDTAGLEILPSPDTPQRRMPADTSFDAGSQPPFRVSHTTRNYWLRRQTGRTTESVDAMAGGLHAALGERFDYLGPVYRMPGTQGWSGLVCPIPNVLLLRVRSGPPEQEFERLLRTELSGLEELTARSDLMSGIRLRYYRVVDGTVDQANAYDWRDRLGADFPRVFEATRLKYIPLRHGKLAAFPADPPKDDAQYDDDLWYLERIHMPEAWKMETGQPSVLIALIDDGFDLAHEDLAASFAAPGVDVSDPTTTAAYDPATLATPEAEDHGTRVAGVAAAQVDNGIGVRGVVPECPVYPLKIDTVTSQELAAAICAAADATTVSGARVRVISMSVGWPDVTESGNDEMTCDEAIAYAAGQDCLLCAGTGNGAPDPTQNLYPARHASVMAIGGTERRSSSDNWADSDRRWESSIGGESHYGYVPAAGDFVSVVAPATGIGTTSVGNTYTKATGTSFATPQAAGVAALVLSRKPSLTAVEVREILERTAERVHQGDPYVYTESALLPNGPHHREVGYGRLDAAAALDAASTVPKGPLPGIWERLKDVFRFAGPVLEKLRRVLGGRPTPPGPLPPH